MRVVSLVSSSVARVCVCVIVAGTGCRRTRDMSKYFIFDSCHSLLKACGTIVQTIAQRSRMHRQARFVQLLVTGVHHGQERLYFGGQVGNFVLGRRHILRRHFD